MFIFEPLKFDRHPPTLYKWTLSILEKRKLRFSPSCLWSFCKAALLISRRKTLITGVFYQQQKPKTIDPIFRHFPKDASTMKQLLELYFRYLFETKFQVSIVEWFYFWWLKNNTLQNISTNLKSKHKLVPPSLNQGRITYKLKIMNLN